MGAMPRRCKNIRRIDSDRAHAYVVQFSLDKRRVEIVFGDAAHQSRGHAYRQAAKVAKAIKTLLN